LGEEVRHHVELETEKNLRAGMGPEEARRKAMIDFGGEERFKEQAREARPTRSLEDFLQDLRYGFRYLRKQPGFTVVALLSLALGVGANTAIFSVVNSVLLKPLPFENPDRIMMVEEYAEGERNPTFSPRDFLDLKEQTTAVDVLAGFRSGSTTLTGEGAPERLHTYSVTADFFEVFGVAPEQGRFFENTAQEGLAGKMVVLSQGTWKNRFGGDPSLVGRTLSLSGEPHMVVGVAPASFDFPEGSEMWIRSYRDGVPEPPVDIGEDLSEIRSLGYFSVIGRLAPGFGRIEAQGEMDLLAGRLAEFKEPNSEYGIGLIPIEEALVGDVRPALFILLGAVGLVLLIACANVANLLLARSATRTQELAVRASLGASSHRIFRQLLVESLLLGAMAGGVGLVLAQWGFGALLSFLPTEIPRLEGVRIDGTVLVFTAGVAVLTGLLFGLMPAFQASRTNLTLAIRSGGRGMVGSGASRHTRELLVLAEVALAVVLLSGAGLLLKSLMTLQDEEVGFNPHGVLVGRLTLPDARYPDEGSMASFVRDLLAEVEEVPGVASAGVALGAPFAGGAATMTYEVEGVSTAEGEDFDSEYQVVTSAYFPTMGIPILEGRGLVSDDEVGEAGPLVAVVSEAFARRHWGDESPLGKRIAVFDDTWMEIVGVSGNVRHFSFEREPRPEIYAPYLLDPWPFFSLVVKTQGDPVALASSVRGAVLTVDPDQPLYSVRSMDQVLKESTGQRRFMVDLLSLFAALAVGLALVGVYGVMAYMVSLRDREMSIRVALGAPRGEVLWLSLRSGVRLAFLGLVAGTAASLALARVLESLLYGVSPWDPGILSLTCATLGGAVLAAAYLPARRAAGTDPARVLRDG
jgi:putative ABC transport system permease protein